MRTGRAKAPKTLAPKPPARKAARRAQPAPPRIPDHGVKDVDAKAPPPNGPAEPGTRIGFLIHDVSRMRRTLYDQAVKPLGLTRSQWWVLAQLSRQYAPDGMLQTELANILDVGKVTIGGLVDRLEESGFVVRRADRDDRRAKRVLVTPEGRKVLKQMVRLSAQLNATIFEGFQPDQVVEAEEFLGRMKSNIRLALGER